MTKTALRLALATLILSGCIPPVDPNHPVASSDGTAERCHDEAVTGSMMMHRVCEPGQRSDDDRAQQERDLQLGGHAMLNGSYEASGAARSPQGLGNNSTIASPPQR